MWGTKESEDEDGIKDEAKSVGMHNSEKKYALDRYSASRGERDDFRVKDKQFFFGHVEFQVLMGLSNRNVI